jgi:hypothetical protein
MRLTAQQQQADYDERKQRCNDGIGSDEDRRLVKQYEAEGFEESRLVRERAAKAAAREQRAGAPVQLDEDDEQSDKLTQRSSKEDWVKFAVAVNGRLAEAERPVVEPENATKADLVAAYGNYAAQA